AARGGKAVAGPSDVPPCRPHEQFRAAPHAVCDGLVAPVSRRQGWKAAPLVRCRVVGSTVSEATERAGANSRHTAEDVYLVSRPQTQSPRPRRERARREPM